MRNEVTLIFIRNRKALRKNDLMACKPEHGDAKSIALELPQICQPGVLPPQGNKLTALRRFFCVQNSNRLPAIPSLTIQQIF